MKLDEFLTQLDKNPESTEFENTTAIIDSNYDYTQIAFTNGNVSNEAGQNEGSCKIFSFAKLNNLSEAQTLYCFGKYYREEVLNDPDGDGHHNIRQFIKTGFDGIYFDGEPLIRKS